MKQVFIRCSVHVQQRKVRTESKLEGAVATHLLQLAHQKEQ
jgi:hypothetical protein